MSVRNNKYNQYILQRLKKIILQKNGKIDYNKELASMKT